MVEKAFDLNLAYVFWEDREVCRKDIDYSE